MTDLDGLQAIARLIEESGVFEIVHLSRTQPRELNAGVGPFAWIRPVGWTENRPGESSEDLPERVRVVHFEILLINRDLERAGEDVTALIAMEAMAQAVARAIDGRVLSPDSIPRLCRVDSGRWSDERGPQDSCGLVGSFAYFPG